MAKQVKSFFYKLYKGFEDSRMRKAQDLISEYKQNGRIGGWE